MEYKYLTEKVDEVKPVLSVELDIVCANANLVRRYIRNTLNGKNISNEKIIACCEGKADGFGRYSSKNGIVQKFTFKYLEGEEKNAFIEARNLAIMQEEQKKKYLEEHDCKLYTWRKPDGNIFYVGQGKKDRYKAIGKYDRHEDFFKILKEYPGCYPNIEKDGLTKEEAENAEKEFIKDLIENKGFKIDNPNLNINNIGKNDYFLVNKTCGGHNEVSTIYQSNRLTYEKRSNAQKKYNNSEKGREQKSKIGKEVQNRPEVKNKRNKAIKDFYNLNGTNADSNMKRASDRWPENIVQNRKMVLHCIELNKTFLSPFQVLPYMMENFNSYIIGTKISNPIRKSQSGIHVTGTIELGDIITQLSWREATQEEIEYEMKRYKEEFDIISKIGDIEGTVEQELLYLDYIEFLEETNTLNINSTNEEFLPNKKLKDYHKIRELEEEKLDEYPEDKYLNNKSLIDGKLNKVHNSFQDKFNRSKQIYCVNLDKSFICPEDARNYINNLTGQNLLADIIGKKSIGYGNNNHEYGSYNGENIIWQNIEKGTKKSEELKQYYENIIKERIEEKNREIEQNRINKLNLLNKKLEELLNEFGLVRGRNKKTNELKIQEFTCDIKEKNRKENIKNDIH